MKVGVFSLVDTLPLNPNAPLKMFDFMFFKIAFSSLIKSVPETFFKVISSYNTVLAFAVMVQSKNEGILMLSSCVLTVVESFFCSTSAIIKSFTAKVLETMLNFPSIFSSLNMNPSKLSIAPVALKSVLPSFASKLFNFTVFGFKVNPALFIFNG